MTIANVDLLLRWSVPTTGFDLFTVDPEAFQDWGGSIFGGSTPVGVDLVSFGTGTPGFNTPPPVSAPATTPPSFLGFALRNIGSEPMTVGICAGPASVPGPFDYQTDPHGLTILASYVLPPDPGIGPGVFQVVSWLPIVSGVYYYVAGEIYAGAASAGRLQAELVGGLATVSGGQTLLLGAGENIFAVGAGTFGIVDLRVGIGNQAALPLAIDVDWGDGNTDSQTVSHSGQGLLVDDAAVFYFFTAPLMPHSYAAPGLYTITVTMTDATGTVRTQTILVAAVGPLTCDLTVTPHATGLPGRVAVAATGHSDAWELMHARSPSTNPDRYDGSAVSGIYTRWHLSVHPGVGLGSDDITVADWTGPGEPTNAPVPASPLPDQIDFPNDGTNQALRHARSPAVVRLHAQEQFQTWSQSTDCFATVNFASYVTSLPRDDGFGASTLRSWPKPVNSVRSVPRIP